MIMASFICHLLYKVVKSKATGSGSSDSESQTPYRTESDLSKEYIDYSAKSESVEDMEIERIRRRTSIGIAKGNNSLLIHRKSLDARSALQEPGLPVVERLSRIISANLDSEDKGGTTEEEEILLERTSSFHPTRVEN